jgi:Mce-associated membrane protein
VAASPAVTQQPVTEQADLDQPAAGETATDLEDARDPVAGDVVPSGRHRRPTLLRRPSGSDGPPPSTSAEAHDGTQDRSAWQRSREPLLILALTAALVLGGLNIWTHFVRSPTNHLTSSSSKAAAAAASAVVVPLLSYNYSTINGQVATVRPLTTALCGTQYANVINKVVEPLATQNQAVMAAQVLSVGVRDASADRVDVLAFVQTTSSSKAKTTKEINEIQLTLTMVKQHGKWLLASTSANGSGQSTPSC